MSRTTYRIDLAYDGGGFAGFRKQPQLRTVESVLLEALRPFIPELPAVACGGRTDRGVHALGQVISFYSRSPVSADQIGSAIEAAAPKELVVWSARRVGRHFHASFSATARRYVMRLEDDGGLDAERLDRLLRPLVGERCMSAFARDTPAGASTVRHLMVAQAQRVSSSLIRLDFAANGFLRRQLRVLVATAIREAQQGADSDALLRICETGDRGATARPLDPGSLYLTGVDYPAD